MEPGARDPLTLCPASARSGNSTRLSGHGLLSSQPVRPGMIGIGTGGRDVTGRCMIEAVVFDLDGVIVDSEPVWEQVRRQVVAEHGGRWAPDAQQRIMGMSTGEWARYLS